MIRTCHKSCSQQRMNTHESYRKKRQIAMLQSFKQLFRQTESATNSDNAAELYQTWPKLGSSLEFSAFGRDLLQKSATVTKPDANEITIENFMKTSAEFPLKV